MTHIPFCRNALLIILILQVRVAPRFRPVCMVVKKAEKSWSNTWNGYVLYEKPLTANVCILIAFPSEKKKCVAVA